MSRKAYHHGNLRAALLEAAADILSEAGTAGLSLRKVAQRAGVSATAPYSHFRDKRDLLAVLAARGFDDLANGMARQQSSTEPATGHNDLISLAKGYVQFALHSPALFQLMFGSELGDLTENPELLEASNRAYGLMETAVIHHREQLGHTGPAPVAVAGAWSIVHGLSILLIDGRVSAEDRGVANNDELIEQVCALLHVG